MGFFILHQQQFHIVVLIELPIHLLHLSLMNPDSCVLCTWSVYYQALLCVSLFYQVTTRFRYSKFSSSYDFILAAVQCRLSERSPVRHKQVFFSTKQKRTAKSAANVLKRLSRLLAWFTLANVEYYMTVQRWCIVFRCVHPQKQSSMNNKAPNVT